jgi:hypothetical protein
MADFRGTILTQKGRNLLAKAQTGTTLTFTRIAIGDGLWSSNTDPTQLNNLVSPKLNLPIQSITVVGDGTVRLRFVLTNTGLSQGFFMREIGIYAQDPDLGEILYAVAYAGDRADFIPADGITKVENVVDIYTVIANAQNVTAVISDTVVLATKQDIDTVKPEASSTAPSLTYPGKLWIDENEFLKYFNGSNWRNLKVSFADAADTVDGFHASLMPAPNVIVPLNASGVLDLSGTYIKSSVYTFRRVDLTNATSDYPLAIGEEAIIYFDTTQSTTKALRVATSEGLYQMLIWARYDTSTNSFAFLYPNNQSYSNAFRAIALWLDESTSTFLGHDALNFSGFWLGRIIQGGLFVCYFSTYRLGKFMLAQQTVVGSVPYGRLQFWGHRWNDTTTSWTSLGTISTNARNGVLTILVRRLA